MQTLTLNLDPVSANALNTALEVSRRQGDFSVARTAVSVISELIRQDEEFKKLTPPVQAQTAE